MKKDRDKKRTVRRQKGQKETLVDNKSGEKK